MLLNVIEWIILVFTARLALSVCALSPSPYLDVCPSGVAQFTCTVEEEGTPGATLWQINGTTHECTVFHSDAPANRSCGPFQLTLNPPVGNSYTSVLRVNSVSMDLNNTDVDCRGPDATILIGNSTLRLLAPPTAPSSLRLSSSDFTGQDSSLQVTLCWTEPVVYPQPSDGAISRYVITSDQAGTCGGPDGCVVSRGGPQFSLREYTLGNLPLSQDYTFTVRADNCQMSGVFQTGMQSEGLPLSLQLPDIPVCHSVPIYSSNGQLVGVEANWTAVMAPVSEVAPGVSGDVTSYVLTIAEIAQSTEILFPNEVCQLSDCSYMYLVNITFTGDSGMYTVILRARNIVGTGLQDECEAIGLTNTLVDVIPRTTDASSPVVQCVFSQLDAGSVASCRVCFGTDQSSLVNCSTGVGSAGEQEVTVTLPPLLTTARYFYRTEASIDGSIVAAVEGTFATECDPADLGGSSDSTVSQQCSSTSAGSVSIPNGVVCYTSTSAGSTASYQCDGGHLVFSGNDTRTCQSDGNWNGAIQNCVFVGLLGWHVALTVLGVVSWVVAAALTVVGLVLILCVRKPALLLWWHWLYIALLCANVVLLLVSAVLWIVFGAVVDNPTGHATELSGYLALRDPLCGVTFALSLAALLVVIAAVVCVHVIQREENNTSATEELTQMKVFEGYEYPDQQEEDEFREPVPMKKRVEEGKSAPMTTVEMVPVPKAKRKSKAKDKTAREATGPTRDGEYSALDHSKKRGEPSAAQQKPDEYQALKHPTGTGTRTQQPTPQQQQPPEVYHPLDHGTSGQLDKPAPPPPPSEQYGTLGTGPHQTTTTTTTAGGTEYGKLNQNPKPDCKKDKGSKGKPKSQPPPGAEYSALGTGRTTEGSAGQQMPEYAEPHAGPRYTPHASNQ